MKIPNNQNCLCNSRCSAMFLALIFILTVSPGSANQENRRIYLEADKVDIDEKAGTSTYQGKVKMTRGQITIEAEKITAHKNNNGLQTMVATGKPVTFTKTQDGQEQTRGQARQIEFDAIEEILTLKDQASLQQSNNQFNGHLIIYNIAKETVVASKGKEQSGRVKVIINPE